MSETTPVVGLLGTLIKRWREQAFKAGYHCRWHKDQGFYCFDPAMSPGDPDGAFKAWLAALPTVPPQAQERPKIVCLCGSTRFIEAFAILTWVLELKGYVVLGCTLLPSWYCPVRDHFAETLGVKQQRDDHHKQKIDLADEVLVIDLQGYIGESTRSEIAYAHEHGKPVKYLSADLQLLQSMHVPEIVAASPPAQEQEYTTKRKI